MSPASPKMSINLDKPEGKSLTGSAVAPLGQSVHELAPEAEKVLAGQVLHDVASGPLYVPAAHVEHCPLLTYCPAEQCWMQLVEPWKRVWVLQYYVNRWTGHRVLQD